jgi:2-keto-4-pentenoate hydratase/2-oxohepta-3-ene-1,7-dioic acid hydratase in catechol pathway
MKLVRFGPEGAERPGVVGTDDALIDVSNTIRDYDPAFFAADDWQARLAAAMQQGARVRGTPRLGSPVAGISKIVGLGMNYREGLARLGLAPPAEPLLFIKSATSIAGPSDPIRLPPDAAKLDWEVELAVVLARPLYRATAAQAAAAVAGYAVINDLSERRWQNEQGGEWCKGKSGDGFAPFGPWLVTPDEVGNPGTLDIWLTLNDEQMQGSSTSDMVVGALDALVYASQFMRLLPCDVIAMGTPPGTGQRQVPPRFLRVGDRLRLGIERLGEQATNVVGAAS